MLRLSEPSVCWESFQRALRFHTGTCRKKDLFGRGYGIQASLSPDEHLSESDTCKYLYTLIYIKKSYHFNRIAARVSQRSPNGIGSSIVGVLLGRFSSLSVQMRQTQRLAHLREVRVIGQEVPRDWRHPKGSTGVSLTYQLLIITGWCFGTWILFFHILRIIIPTVPTD